MQLTMVELGLWVVVLWYGIRTLWKLTKLVYPDGPKPVPEGEIEDAVLVYTWPEAFVLMGSRLRFMYALLLITIILTVT